MSSMMPLLSGSTPTNAALGSDSLIQDSEKSHEHPCLQPGGGFTVPVSVRTCTLGLCRTGQEAVHGQVLTEDWNTPALYTKSALQTLACPLSPKCPPLPTSLDSNPCFVSKVFVRFLFLNYSLFFFPGTPMVPECRPLGYLHTCTS